MDDDAASGVASLPGRNRRFVPGLSPATFSNKQFENAKSAAKNPDAAKFSKPAPTRTGTSDRPNRRPIFRRPRHFPLVRGFRTIIEQISPVTVLLV